MSEDRPTIEVAPVPGGWPAPWPSVAELAEALPAGSWTLVDTALEALGYRFQPSIDARNHTAHRFIRGTTTVDLVAGAAEDQVDVLIADHPAPRVIEKLRGHEMIHIEGGTCAAPSTHGWRSWLARPRRSRCRVRSAR